MSLKFRLSRGLTVRGLIFAPRKGLKISEHRNKNLNAYQGDTVCTSAKSL